MNTMRAVRAGLAPLLAAGALAGLSPVAAEAQTKTLTWDETTRLEVPGTLGALLRATGATRPIETRNALHLQGRALIQETDDQANVLDLENGRWMWVDHTARTTMSMTFDEMAQMSREALDQAYASAQADAAQANADAAAAREEWEREMAEIQAELEFRVSAEATGQRQRIGSYNATQHFILTEFEATAVPEGVEQREGGSMIFLAELWQTDEIPSADDIQEEFARMLATDARLREMANEVVASSAESSEAMAEALATWNPQISAGILKMAEAMETITGTTLRSTVTVAIVPLGVQLDRAALVAWQPESMGTQLRAGAADAARQAAGDAVRGAIGRLGGLRGGGQQAAAAPEPAADAPAVTPLFRMTTDRSNIAYRESREDVVGILEARAEGYARR